MLAFGHWECGKLLLISLGPSIVDLGKRIYSAVTSCLQGSTLRMCSVEILIIIMKDLFGRKTNEKNAAYNSRLLIYYPIVVHRRFYWVLLKIDSFFSLWKKELRDTNAILRGGEETYGTRNTNRMKRASYWRAN